MTLDAALCMALDTAADELQASLRLLNERAKKLPRSLRNATSEHQEQSRTTSLVGAIEVQTSAPCNAVHGANFVQAYRVSLLEQRLLDLLNGHEFTPVWRIAELARLSVCTARAKLEKLDAKGFVEAEPRRGYRRK